MSDPTRLRGRELLHAIHITDACKKQYARARGLNEQDAENALKTLLIKPGCRIARSPSDALPGLTSYSGYYAVLSRFACLPLAAPGARKRRFNATAFREGANPMTMSQHELAEAISLRRHTLIRYLQRSGAWTEDNGTEPSVVLLAEAELKLRDLVRQQGEVSWSVPPWITGSDKADFEIVIGEDMVLHCYWSEVPSEIFHARTLISARMNAAAVPFADHMPVTRIADDAKEYFRRSTNGTEADLLRVLPGARLRPLPDTRSGYDFVLELDSPGLAFPVVWHKDSRQSECFEIRAPLPTGVNPGLRAHKADARLNQPGLILAVESSAPSQVEDGSPPVTLTGGEWTLGRSPGADIEVTDPTTGVSRLHGVLLYQAGRWFFINKSRYGTRVWLPGGEPVDLAQGVAQQLFNDMRLRMGQAVTLRVSLTEPEPLPGLTTAGAVLEPDATLPLLGAGLQPLAAALAAVTRAGTPVSLRVIADYLAGDTQTVLEGIRRLAGTPGIRERMTRLEDEEGWLEEVATLIGALVVAPVM